MPEVKLVLVDTSSWVEALRKDGRPEIRERVNRLMTEGRVAWCDMVLVELWSGARGEKEKRQLKALEQEIDRVPIDDNVWSLACTLARQCRAVGKTFPPTDYIIVACGVSHGVDIEHCDSHFDQILMIHAGKSQDR